MTIIEKFDYRYFVVAITVAGLLIIQYFISGNVFTLSVAGYSVELAIGDLVLTAILAIVFASWCRASILYKRNSSFGRFIMGLTVFLALKTIASTLYILSYVVKDLHEVFFMSYHFFNVASYLPLYASLIIVVFENRILFRARAPQDIIYSYVVVYGLPAIVWLYFVFFIFKEQIPYLNTEALALILTLTIYFILDIVILILSVPILTSKFREGVMQGSVESATLAIVVYSLADIFANAMLVFNIMAGQDLLHVLTSSAHSLAYLLMIFPSHTFVNIIEETSKAVIGLGSEFGSYDISNLKKTLRNIVGKRSDELFRAIGLSPQKTIVSESEFLRLRKMLEIIFSRPIAEDIIKNNVVPLKTVATTVESREALAVDSEEIDKLSAKLSDPLFLSDIILNSKMESIGKLSVTGINVEEVFSKMVLGGRGNSYLLTITSPRDFESKILIVKGKIKAVIVKKPNGSVISGTRALDYLRKYVGEVETTLLRIHEKEK